MRKRGTCSVEGCPNPNWSRGYCSAHYQRLQRTGDVGGAETGRRIGCKVEGCVEHHYGLGYCYVHYKRFKAHGDPLVIKQRKANMSIPELIDWMVSKSVRMENGCLEFRNLLDKNGYGHINAVGKEKKKWRAHRLVLSFVEDRKLDSWELACHTCHNPTCIEPTHLYVGSSKDNQQDMSKSGRATHGTAHHNAKLTPHKVRVIRKYAGRLSSKFMAETLGVSMVTINNVIKRSIWKEVA